MRVETQHCGRRQWHYTLATFAEMINYDHTGELKRTDTRFFPEYKEVVQHISPMRQVENARRMQ
jgi:hypothetical protein